MAVQQPGPRNQSERMVPSKRERPLDLRRKSESVACSTPTISEQPPSLGKTKAKTRHTNLNQSRQWFTERGRWKLRTLSAAANADLETQECLARQYFKVLCDWERHVAWHGSPLRSLHAE
ncbi:hypothetical protein V8C35DRAFT_196841 [Trichoderma chlorosporum]